MANGAGKTLMAAIPADEFVGRDRELDILHTHALSAERPFGMLLSSAPGCGASELLRQTYDRLFFGQAEIIPFYFALRPSDRSAGDAAERFLQQFLLQAAAFRQQDPAVLDSSPDIEELAQIAPQADAFWFDALIETARRDRFSEDGRDRMRSGLSAPLRASARGPRVFAMIDDLHLSLGLNDGDSFVDELGAVFARARVPFVFSARRRFDFRRPELSVVSVGPLGFAAGGQFVDRYSDSVGAVVNDQTRDLIATQFGGVPLYIRMFVNGARDAATQLDSYQKVEQLYARQIVVGRFALHFKSLIEAAVADPEAARKVVGLLHGGTQPAAGSASPDAWQRRLDLEPEEFRHLIRSLEVNEFIDSGTSQIKVNTENTPLVDYLETRYRIENSPAAPATVEARLVTASLKRAPQIMARLYRREAAAGLQELMQGFDIQSIPAALIDYRRFRDSYKGREEAEVRRELMRDENRIDLPQISHTAPISAHYPPIGTLIDEERTSVGVGFTDRSYADDKQIVWIAAEIESKLEAGEDAATYWTDQISAAAAACGFTNFRTWLIAPEGFTESALRVLDERGAIGTSRRQVELLKEYLATGGSLETGAVEEIEYEMVIPMGEDTELIAAHALEEIARRHSFPPKTINQIKTALVEACINAAEHGLSPDRKIHQRFKVGDRRIVITISNRGVRLIDKPGTVEEPSEGRRGWGLNLMRTLMDDVRIEQVDDGTRITMTKYLDVNGTLAAA
jgi:serine/threonine-protein kinase RsbW